MRFKTIRTKLLVYICTLTILSAVILQAVNLITVNASFNQLVPNGLQSALRNAYSVFKSNIEEDMNALRAISTMPAIQDTSQPLDVRAALLKNFIEKNADTRGYQACAITDTKGAAVLSSGFAIDVAGDEYFREAIKGTQYISDPFESVATGKLIVVYAMPYNDASGKLAGVITLDVDALHLSNNLDSAVTGESGIAFVIDSQGVTVASNDKQTVTDRYSDFDELIGDTSLAGIVELEKRMIAGESGQGEYVYNGNQELMAFMPVEGTSWSLGITQTKAEAYGALDTITLIGSIVLVAIAALSAVLALILSRSISKPIANLAVAAGDLAVGDTRSALKLSSNEKDELGKLTHTFSDMAKSIEEQAQILTRVAGGDLTMRVIPRSEHDTLSLSLSSMLEGNNATLSEVSMVGSQVALGARQISSSGQHLAQSSTEQTAAVDQISRAIVDMEAKIGENLGVSENASALSREAEGYLTKSGENMQNMRGAMEDIKHASDSIANVTKLIEDIAFQTNILALNAAVEAARAGQHGKGFAVVAEEVRTLAARSAEAASETTKLIENSIDKVKGGARIADETGASMEQVADISGRIIELISQIAESSRQQSEAISQINSGIEQVNVATASNSAAAEESASSSQELLDLANRLSEMMMHYTLEAGERHERLTGGY